MGACVSLPPTAGDYPPYPQGGGYAPPVITGPGGAATAGAMPGGIPTAAAPAQAFGGVGFVVPGAAFPGCDAPIPTEATFVPPPQPAPGVPPPAAVVAPPVAGGQVAVVPGGRRKALLVSCCYQGTSAELKGCFNDSRCMQYFLTQRFAYPPDSILMLSDMQPNPALWPTRANILAAMRWLVADAAPGDHLFFHYSGHGSQTNDWTGDEADGMNETILPVDFKRAGQIVDDELNVVLVNPLPAGVKLHAVVDACHSGSTFDLPYRTELTAAGASWEREYTHQPRMYKGTAGGFAVQFGAARDSQVAADTAQLSGTVSTGAATFAFIQAIEKEGVAISYGRLLHAMFDTMRSSVGVSSSAPGAPQPPGGAALGGLLGALLGVGMMGSMRGQNPVLSASEAFDLNSPLDI